MSSKTAGERARERKTIGRTAAWLAKQVEIGLGSVDLSLPQYRVLGLLDESPAFSSALAERLAVRPPSVTAIVDPLVPPQNRRPTSVGWRNSPATTPLGPPSTPTSHSRGCGAPFR